MFRVLRSLLITGFVLALSAAPALASTLATVTSITGAAMVMRDNKVEKLYVGSKIEKGDRVIVNSASSVILSNGTVIGPGTSAVAKGKSGTIEITTTASSSSSSSSSQSNSSKLFSDKDDDKSKDKNKNKGKGKGKDDDDDDDHDDDDDDHDDDDDEYGNPKDPKGVSY